MSNGFNGGAGKLKLPAESAVDRIGAAAAQRDREHDQAPEQRVFPATAAGGEAGRPMGDERRSLATAKSTTTWQERFASNWSPASLRKLIGECP